MTRIVIVLFLVLLLASVALAERPWAPGVTSSSTGGGGFKLPPLSFRLGLSLASANWDRLDEKWEPDDVSANGLFLEAGIRPITAPLNSKASFAFEVPVVFSILQGKLWTSDNETIGLIGRMIPTARLDYALNDKLAISPYLGIGIGSQLGISGGGLAQDFHLTWVYRIGADLSLTEKWGVGLGLLQNTFDDDYGDVYDSSTKSWKDLDGNRKLKELVLSVTLKL